MEAELASLHQEIQRCRRCSGLRPWSKFKTDTHGNPTATLGAEAALIPLLHPSRANMYMDYGVYRRHLADVFSRR